MADVNPPTEGDAADDEVDELIRRVHSIADESYSDELTRRLHSTDDAMVWATEFVGVLKAKNDDGLVLDLVTDVGFMVGWFANADRMQP